MFRASTILFLLAPAALATPAFAQFAPLPPELETPRLSTPEVTPVPPAISSLPLDNEAFTPRRLRPTLPSVKVRPVVVPRPPDTFGQTPDQIYPWMFSVARTRPNRVRLIELGHSSTGQTMWALEIRPSERAQVSKLKRLAVICRQHGNEPEATVSGTRFISQFLSAATPTARAVSQKVALLVVPIANPDGAAVYQRRTAQNIDMNRDWGHNRSPEVRALTQMVKWWKPNLVVDNHQWLPFEKMPPPMAEASGGKLAKGVAQNMSQSNAARGFYLSARSRWGLDSLCHRYWGQRFGVPAILLETRHRPSVQGARDVAIAQALSALWAATKTLAR